MWKLCLRGEIEFAALFFTLFVACVVACSCTKSSDGPPSSEASSLAHDNNGIIVGMNEADGLPFLKAALGNPEELAVEPPKDETGEYKRLYFFRNGDQGVIQITSKRSTNDAVWLIDEISISNQFDALAKKENPTDWEVVTSIDAGFLSRTRE